MVSRLNRAVLLWLFLAAPLFAQTTGSISLHDRVVMATQIYHQVTTYFPEVPRQQFDHDYSAYLEQVLGASDDRRAFDLASMALVATLHDGHTWFYDNWLATNYGQHTGLTVYPLDGQWTVTQSELASLRAGDVIEAVDGTPTQKYFEQNRKYLSASSDRDGGTSLFDTPVVFPQRFTLTLDAGRQVTIDRQHDVKQPLSIKTEGRWLVPDRVGYIKVPTFHGLETQLAALEFLRQFHNAKAIILDVRGNPGTGDPGLLQRSLMDKPYAGWSEHSAMHGGFLLRAYGTTYPEDTQVASADAVMRPREPAVYTGKLFLLIDRGCTCACEDFTMPFKTANRAQLVGETTAGTFSFTYSTSFENGMRLNISTVRHTFPDGSRFEGIGIAPDVEVPTVAQDLKQGKDPVLQKALQLANQ